MDEAKIRITVLIHQSSRRFAGFETYANALYVP